jgi:hypothetical protein
MGILQTVSREHVTFDPANTEHRHAFYMLHETGKQDSKLRFVLEEPYSSVLSMMADKIALHYSRPASASVRTLPRLARGVKNG